MKNCAVSRLSLHTRRKGTPTERGRIGHPWLQIQPVLFSACAVLFQFLPCHKTQQPAAAPCLPGAHPDTVHTGNALFPVRTPGMVPRNCPCRAFFCTKPAGHTFPLCLRFQRHSIIYSVRTVSRKLQLISCPVSLHSGFDLCRKIRQFPLVCPVRPPCAELTHQGMLRNRFYPGNAGKPGLLKNILQFRQSIVNGPVPKYCGLCNEVSG